MIGGTEAAARDVAVEACQASVAVCLRSGRCSCEAELCGCRVALSAAAWGLSWVGGLSLRWRQLNRQCGAVGSSSYFTVMVAFYVNEFLFSSATMKDRVMNPET